ncbi:hypothetical protein BRADI_4g08370v3 [Brachypodium distachyon]|uniref:Expansin-like CBD domain-containing protein n=1 Tax=Brachypodium distachyon TaxID=15368 RepID=A0A2K2CL90_BRADI|nr:hypothetical protein BRADI_4g08370v3 [Brachypodium distachyon]
MARFSSSGLLAFAMAATLFAGVWCAPKVTFTVEKGSDPKKIVELKQKGSNEWLAMSKCKDTGAWKYESPEPPKCPLNIRFQSEKGMRNVFDDVIPENYKIGSSYAPQEY